MTDIAIAHDQFEVLGGAEHVALEMARALDAPIYAGTVDYANVPADVEVHEVFTSYFGRRCLDSHHRVQEAYQMLAWQQMDALHDYDTVVVSKREPGWYVPRDYQAIVRMVYSPSRDSFDLFHRLNDSIISPAIEMFRRALYEPQYAYPDEWVAISELVARRMNLYTGVEADEVIYPPVYTDKYGPEAAGDDGNYYFTVGRLVDHKRVDEIVAAFTRHHTDKRLVIAGEGPEREALEQMAGRNIEFVGYISDAEKRRRLAECRAFIFNAKNEDFGLTVPEALASGTPAIGVRDGYTPSQIAHGETGLLYDRGVSKLAAAVDEFETAGVTATPAACQQAAKRYDISAFRTQIRDVVERATAQARDERTVTPPAPPATPIADGGGAE